MEERQEKYRREMLLRYLELEGEKRCNWKLAVVEELIVGKDKEVRGAKVRVAGKENYVA